MKEEGSTHHGNIQTFKAIFNEFYPGMFKTALYYTNHSTVAEDITQEVFTRLWEKRSHLDEIDNLKGYLQHAVKNHCLNYIQHLKVVDKYQQDYLKWLSEEENPPEEYTSLVTGLLEQLPPKRRAILEMSILESKSYQEIAVQMEISINTVKDHIKKAYAFLRENVNQEISDFILYLSFTRKWKSIN